MDQIRYTIISVHINFEILIGPLSPTNGSFGIPLIRHSFQGVFQGTPAIQWQHVQINLKIDNIRFHSNKCSILYKYYDAFICEIVLKKPNNICSVDPETWYISISWD